LLSGLKGIELLADQTLYVGPSDLQILGSVEGAGLGRRVCHWLRRRRVLSEELEKIMASKALSVADAILIRGSKPMQKRIIEDVEAQRASENVYAAFCLPDAEKLKIRTILVVEFRKAMRILEVNQQTAATYMFVAQEEVLG
jgi:predicted XRE-type DNA-binding protein